MGRIAVLPPEVAARIAAGEVIERPASVVKELCDNAVDAGARRVRVELEQGGLAAVAVTDDGSGMDPDDAALCFLRHATSKIRSFADLAELRSLGFRGEALPSIAAVCRVELVTRTADAAVATRVRVEGGGPPEVAAAGGPPGTRVVARDIFFNTPARRAALRAAARERALALQVVAAAALARPDVAFEVWCDGREVLSTPGDGELLSAAVALWGPEAAGAMVRVRGRDAGWEVDGLASTPARCRGDRSLQFVAVDGRAVRADAVRGAVEAAYVHLLPGRRFPAYALRLRAAPGLYDPNVHPSKREVRVYREEPLRELCRRAVRAALGGTDLVPSAGAHRTAPARIAGGPRASLPAPRAAAGDLRGAAGPARAGGARGRWTDAVAFAMEAQDRAREVPDAAWDALPAVAPSARAAPGAGEGGTEPGAVPARAAGGPQGEPAPGRLPPLLPLGQVAAAYLVAEGPDGLYLVDQHAAHERVLYERLCRRQVPPRPLLTPTPVRLDPEAYARWEAAAAELAGEGFTAEPFGDGYVLLRAVPGIVAGDPAEALLAVLERLEGAEPGPLALRRAMVACRGAVKAGQPLPAGEAGALLEALAACAEPFTCPHGRPTVVRFSVGELDRMFARR